MKSKMFPHPEEIKKSGENEDPWKKQGPVTILVPTLNEVENIDHLVERILAATGDSDFSVEIIFVDGGSKDGTQQKVLEWSRKGPVRLAQSDGKGGLSGDILYGASVAKTDIVVVMDADLSHPPETLPAMIAPLLRGTHDMAIGSRYIPGGKTPGWPWTRRLTSRVATLLAWPLVSISDPMSGFFAIGRERLIDFGKMATGFKIAMEIAARGDESLRVIEVPITFVDRERGTSKFGTAEIVSCLKQMLLLAGGSVSTGNAVKFAAVGSLGVLVDYIIFNILLGIGIGIVPSHITSFFCATIFNYIFNAHWTFAAARRRNEKSPWRLYLSFLSVCVLALIFRGATLAVLTESASWSPRVAIFVAIAAATVINFIGSAFFVFPQAQGRSTTAIRWRVFAFAVVVYSVIVRLVFTGIIDLIPEEAYYWNYAQHLDIGYLDHPPMVAWLIWIGTRIAGDNELGVRFLAMPLWVVTAFFLYRLAKDFFGKTAAFIAVMFLAVFPVYFSTGFLMLPDAPLYAAWAGCLYFLERALVTKRGRAWIWAGICLGLGMLSKYTMVFLVPSTFLFLLIDKGSRQWLARRETYLALVIGLILFSPVIIWNATHCWASFAFQGMERWSGEIHVSPHLLFASALVLLTPVGFAGVVGAITAWRKNLFQTGGDMNPRLRWLFGVIFAMVPLAIFFVYSFSKAPRLHWTGPVWLSILPMMAGAVAVNGTPHIAHWYRRFNMSVWKPTMAIMLLFYGVFMYYMLIGMPGLSGLFGESLPVAWKTLGREVGCIEKKVESQTDKEPLIVGMDIYPISAQLSFYLPEPEAHERVSGRHLFGRKSLMWSEWSPAKAALGKTVILVSFKEDSISGERLARFFENLGPVSSRDIMKDNLSVGRFYYRVGYGYLGSPREKHERNCVLKKQLNPSVL